MILKSFGLYLNQKRYQAVWVVLLCAFLPFIQIPLSFVAITIIGLVTLHQGAKEGFILWCWMVLPAIAASFYGDFGMLLVEGISKGLVVWLLAWILGSSASWRTTVQLAVLCGLVVVVAFHLLVTDVTGWWLQQLEPYRSQIQASWNLNLSAEQTKLFLERVAHFATGVVVAGALALDIVLLLVARAWQAILYNPGGLALEWRQLQLDYWYSGILLIILSGIWLGASWLMDLLPVILMPFVFAGLSLVHAKLPEQKNIRLPALCAFYLAMLFFSPYMCLMLVFIAFLDSWYDFRSLRAK